MDFARKLGRRILSKRIGSDRAFGVSVPIMSDSPRWAKWFCSECAFDGLAYCCVNGLAWLTVPSMMSEWPSSRADDDETGRPDIELFSEKSQWP